MYRKLCRLQFKVLNGGNPAIWYDFYTYLSHVVNLYGKYSPSRLGFFCLSKHSHSLSSATKTSMSVIDFKFRWYDPAPIVCHLTFEKWNIFLCCEAVRTHTIRPLSILQSYRVSLHLSSSPLLPVLLQYFLWNRFNHKCSQTSCLSEIHLRHCERRLQT